MKIRLEAKKENYAQHPQNCGRQCICVVPFFFPVCSLITSEMVGSVPALHIDFYFVPSFSKLWLIPAGSKTNKWNLLLIGAIHLDKHPLCLWDSWEKYQATSS